MKDVTVTTQTILSEAQAQHLLKIAAVQPVSERTGTRKPLNCQGARLGSENRIVRLFDKRFGVTLTPASLAGAVFILPGKLYTDGTSVWTSDTEAMRKASAKASAKIARARKAEAKNTSDDLAEARLQAL